MKKYELLLVLPGTLDDKQSEARSQEILGLIKDNSQDAEIHVLGKNRLAYPIKQIRYGYYYTIVFSAESAQLKVIQDKLGLMRDLLRTMISYFNTTLTTAQKITYTTDDAGMTVMAPRAVSTEEMVRHTGNAQVKAEEKEEAAVKPVAEKIDIEDINKKLDDIMKGDVV